MIATAIFRLSTAMISTTRTWEIGDQDEQELAQAIDDAIRRAAKHLPNRLKESFRNVVLEYKDIFAYVSVPIRLSMFRPWKSSSKAWNALSRCDAHVLSGAAGIHEEEVR